MLGRKYGPDLQASASDISELENRVRRAAVPANAINQRFNVNRATIPTWEGAEPQGGYIHSGLAKISSVTPGGQEIFTTNVPFNFHENEILTLEQARERIQGAFDTSPADVQEKYQADINRIDQLIKMHRIMQTHESINPHMYGVYQSGGLG